MIATCTFFLVSFLCSHLFSFTAKGVFSLFVVYFPKGEKNESLVSVNLETAQIGGHSAPVG